MKERNDLYSALLDDLRARTGWEDVALTPKGEEEARSAGSRLTGMTFDRAYSSVLTRARHTLELILEEIGRAHV